MSKGKIVGKVKRKEGYLYYVDKYGNVRETPMRWNKRRGRKKRR